jgi:hypothetical protein
VKSMLHHMDTSLWLLPALLIAIALAAPRYGVDSRDGYDWNRRFGPPDPPPPMASRRRSTPAADLAALVRLIRRMTTSRASVGAPAAEAARPRD